MSVFYCTCMYICVLLCVLNKDQSINFSSRNFCPLSPYCCTMTAMLLHLFTQIFDVDVDMLSIRVRVDMVVSSRSSSWQ